MNQTHFFFALRIPEETKLIMKKHGEKLKERIPFSRWVHHEDLHITLAFLGDAPSEKLLIAEKNVKEALKNSNTFNLQINQLGIFGRVESPRIFWADTSESRELQDLRKKVYTACVDAGFQLETRPFRPHITIARKWKGEEGFQMELLEIWKKLQPEPLMFDAAEVVLYQTHLHKTPKYEPITRFPLTSLSL
jgi:RNA 2',3'-cyclic 3'-phosphodiesterase